MNRTITLSLMILSFLLPSITHADEPKGIPLIEKGLSQHVIVLSETASPSEKTAANELQLHINACTGAELPILTEKPAADTPMIVLGCGPLAKTLGVDPAKDQLGEQGFVIKTVDNHIVIAGTPEAGTLYGVHRFLEDYFNVRWYAPEETKTPKTKTIMIPKIDGLEKPAFPYRRTSWYNNTLKDQAFITRVAQNSGSGQADNPWGIQYTFLGTCHSYFRFINPKTYFTDHPEYFSEIGGQRLKDETQLCLTNPEVLDIVTEKMLKLMKEKPQYRQYNFSQMDYYNYCQCDKCKAMYEKYGTTGATQFWFVNEVAKRTSKVYPDKLIGTLSYTYTEEPPKGMKMHPNVAVWLCHMFPCCDSHPVRTCPLNAEYKRRAETWSEICDHLYIWHYVTDFAHYFNPWPNFRAVADDLKFYNDIGVEGLYLQGCGNGGNGGGEFYRLRPWVLMKLAWNPDQNLNALVQEFLKGYYGPAAKPIYDYFALLHDKVEKENIHMHLYTNPAQGYLTDDVIQKAQTLFDQAEELVKDDPTLLERVKVARMPIVYARMFPRNGYKIENGKLTFNGKIAPVTEVAEFVSRMKAHSFPGVREHHGDPQQLFMLAAAFGAPQDVVTISNPHLTVDIVPMLSGRILRIIDKKTNQCVTAYDVRKSLYYPFCGGLENRIGETFWSTGWIEPAMLVDSGQNAATVQLKTTDGLILKRSVTLDPKEPIIRINAVVTNPAKKPKTVRLRTHLELDLGDVRTTQISFTNREGKQITRTGDEILSGMREGEHFTDSNTPNGEWTFTGSKKLTLTQRFDRDAVDFTWVYSFPEDLNDLEVELWPKRLTLKPGESTEAGCELEIRPN